MEGGISESTKGMIPRAVEQVFQVAEMMEKKGWGYKMEGQFLEIVSGIPRFSEYRRLLKPRSTMKLSTTFSEWGSWTRRSTK